MSRLIANFALVGGVLGLLLSGRTVWAQKAADSLATAPPLGQPRPLVLPAIQQETLPNGLKLVLLEDHRQPALWMRLAMPAGSIRDPRDKIGLAAMTASLLDKGTSTRTESKIADTIDGLGASLGASAGDDYLTVSAAGLSPYSDTLFSLMADITLHPTFPNEELERTRTRLLNEIAFAISQPGTMADAAFSRLIYGAHPYGDFSSGTPKTLATITSDDLKKFHDTYFVPNGSTLFLVGDITPAEAKAKALAAFGEWGQKQIADLPAAPKPQEVQGAKPHITLIDRPDAAQTEIRIGVLSSGYSTPNRIIATVSTAVLGLGQFEGRLTKEIRVKRGLTYGVASFFDRHKQAGEFEISTFTKNASTGEVVKLALEEADKLTHEEVGAEELADRKTFLTGSFAVSAATSEGLLQRLVPAVLEGMGPTELTTYIDRVDAVTPGQIRQEMSGLGLNHVEIVLVGDAKAIQSQVASIGTVTVIPYDSVDLLSPTLRGKTDAQTDPKKTSDAGMPAATPEELAAGKTRLAAAVRAHGGDAFLNVKTATIKGKGNIRPPGNEVDMTVPIEAMTLTLVVPDKTRLDMTTGFGEVAVSLPGGAEKPWFLFGGMVNNASAGVAMLARFSNPILLLARATQNGYRVRGLPAAGTDPVISSAAGKALQGFAITDDKGVATQIYTDPDTNLVRRLVYPNPKGDLTISFANYRATDGVQMPGVIEAYQNKTKLFDFTFDSIALNKSVDAGVFARPK